MQGAFPRRERTIEGAAFPTPRRPQWHTPGKRWVMPARIVSRLRQECRDRPDTPADASFAGAWADMCLICLRLCAGLMNGRVSGFPDFLLAGRSAGETDGHGAVGYLPMAIAGFLEEARAAATRTFISAADASVFGQDDVSTPAFLAWSKCMAAGQSLDSALAVLAVAASQALHVLNRERVPNRLVDFLSLVRSRVPPVHADRVLGPEMQRLAGDLTARTFADDHVGRGVAA